MSRPPIAAPNLGSTLSVHLVARGQLVSNLPLDYSISLFHPSA